ncbi:AraC family transcriptional regulator [Mucilaginibacter daejeonensis]|uniref:helix-turn-helix domain-containing protein n=1 Tax=Mucilaginibacter daejeonensis TaxID=398049 RepID=UPI001D17530E|nr:helix-turn-helix domain-containing protein [Mucilaginibacter daejeonensis]UEG54623.1 AraC family transcriptional regulator [Mucilaginibacter daejeonensis]
MRTLDRTSILYSCYQQRSREGEQFIAEHVFGVIISGTQKLFVDGETYEFGPGDLRFFRKDQLCRFEKEPPPGGEFLSVSVFLSKDTLRAMSIELDLHADGPYTGDAIKRLAPNKLLQNYIDSLSPYLHGSDTAIDPALTNLKVREAVMLLLQTNPDLKNALFDLSEPGKIDLQSFMNANYRFNVDISRFAYLTGRSLATFKRDFERIYHTSPSRWLQQQRLNDAYFLIKQKGKPVSDVYLEVGFKDLSHFSFAFKKVYGVSPTMV